MGCIDPAQSISPSKKEGNMVGVWSINTTIFTHRDSTHLHHPQASPSISLSSRSFNPIHVFAHLNYKRNIFLLHRDEKAQFLSQNVVSSRKHESHTRNQTPQRAKLHSSSTKEEEQRPSSTQNQESKQTQIPRCINFEQFATHWKKQSYPVRQPLNRYAKASRTKVTNENIT